MTTTKPSAEVLSAAKFYARASAYRAVHGYIPKPDAAADGALWESTAASVREGCIAMATGILQASGDAAYRRGIEDLLAASLKETERFTSAAGSRNAMREQARALAPPQEGS